MQKPDTSISFYFPFSVISQFGKLSRRLSKVFYFILFYFILFYFVLGLISRSMVHFAKFLKKVDFVTNVVVYSFLRVQVVQLFDKVVVTIMCFR